MDNVFEISLLLDFYGSLLTERQFEMLDLHYNNDFSLGEIAEQLEISRQGVYDNIKRGKETLFELENKLRLVQKFTEQKSKAEEILKYVKCMDKSSVTGENKTYLKKIEVAVGEIINGISQ